jgi:ankyrin repeat protein
MTALHWAAYYDNVETAQLLIEAGSDVHAKNRYQVPILSLACKNGNPEMVDLLLEAGAAPQTSLPGGETVLMTAARTGIAEPVVSLLQHGAKVNAKDRKGQTALMWAAADGHAEVTRLLLAAGADFQTPLESGFTPLFFAVRQGHVDVVRELLAVGADVNEALSSEKKPAAGPSTGMSPLQMALENGHFELALVLLESGADPNDQRMGYTPLHAITWVRKPLRGDTDPPPIGSGRIDSLEFVRRLVSMGADVNSRHGKQNASNGRLNRSEATPFFLACDTGDLPLMKLLLELGADPSATNSDNCTPLLAAAGVGILGNGDESAGTEEEAIEAIRLLLTAGADINAVDDRGNAAMHGAANQSWTKLIPFLVENGADVSIWNRQNNFGWTPLMVAQGHRPGNYRPSPETTAAIMWAMRKGGVEPPTD